MPDGYEVSISQVVYMIDSTLPGIPVMSICLIIWHSVRIDHVQGIDQVCASSSSTKGGFEFSD